MNYIINCIRLQLIFRDIPFRNSTRTIMPLGARSTLLTVGADDTEGMACFSVLIRRLGVTQGPMSLNLSEELISDSLHHRLRNDDSTSVSPRQKGGDRKTSDHFLHLVSQKRHFRDHSICHRWSPPSLTPPARHSQSQSLLAPPVAYPPFPHRPTG